MPRQRSTKKSTTTAIRHTEVPSATKSKPATTAAAAPAAESKPVVTTTAVATACVDSKPVATTAAPKVEKAACALAAHLLALGNADADTARDAATALGTLGDKSAVAPLIEALNNPAGYFHSVVRAAAAASLGQLGDRKAVEPLLSAIGDPSAEVSSESIRALAVLGDARAIDALIDVAQNRCGYFLPVTRQAAILALAKLGGGRAAGELRTIAASEFEEPAIRHAAKTGIEQGTANAAV